MQSYDLRTWKILSIVVGLYPVNNNLTFLLRVSVYHTKLARDKLPFLLETVNIPNVAYNEIIAN